ncbi:MAG: hypothetical protein ACKOBW_17725 [Planctomycetota bacterium]
MDDLSTDLVQQVLQHRSTWCVTIYLPTHVGHHENRDDAIQLKNVADQLTDELIAHGMRPAAARELMLPVRQLPLDEPYWAERGAGLAVFLSPDTFQALRLSRTVPLYTVVNRRFHVRHLLPIVTENHHFFVLAISQKFVTLFRGDRDHLQPVDLPALKLNRELVLNLDMGERGGQIHSGGRFNSLKQGAIASGHGGMKDTNKAELLSYLRRINDEIQETIKREQLPLVLATVDFLAPLFRQVCDYPHLIDSFVTGSPDHLSPVELQARAWHLVTPLFTAAQEQSIQRFQQLFRSGRALDQISEVMPSIIDGRVEALLMDESGECWGNYSPEERQLVLHETRRPGDDDLIDWAAGETWLRRGTVHSLPHHRMPTNSPLAAIMRF